MYATDTWGTQDTQTGQYYEGSAYGYVNFEGQNPKHPSEYFPESMFPKTDRGPWRWSATPVTEHRRMLGANP